MQPELIEKTETSRAIIKTLEKNGIIKLQEEKVIRNPLENKDIKQTNKLKFTEEQEEAYTKVSNAIEKQKSYRYCKTKVMSSKKVGQNFQEKFCPPPLRENLCVRENYQ